MNKPKIESSLSIFQKKNNHAFHLAAVLIWFIFLWTGFRGLDCGRHWDESILIHNAMRSFHEDVFLPHNYLYPSFAYDMVVLGMLPTVISEWKTTFSQYLGSEDLSFVKRLSDQYEGSMSLRVKLRIPFLVISSFSIIWIYLIVLVWKKDPLEAVLASALFAGSWEIAYHSRWIATDTLVTQFSALTILTIFLWFRFSKKWILWLAALFAGFTLGTKYNSGAACFLFVISASFCNLGDSEKKSFLTKIKTAILLCFIFTIGFVLTTPGVILEPYKFHYDLTQQMEIYTTGHYGYTVSGPLEYAYLVVKYLILAAFSRAWPVSVTIAIFAFVGFIKMLLKDARRTMLFASMPFILLIIMFSLKVMIVRNYLPVFILISVAAAHGIVFCFRKIPQTARLFFAIGIVGMLLVNYVWLFKSAELMVKRSEINHAQNLLKYIQQKPSRKIFLSPEALKMISDKAPLLNIAKAADGAEEYIFLASELDKSQWVSNHFGAYKIISAPFEANYNYYPDWEGDVRVVSVSIPLSKRLGLPENV